MSKTSSASKIKMKSFEDLFGTNEVVGAKNISGEIRDIPLNSLHTFRNHPFKVREEKLDELVESVKQHGVLVPGIARMRPQGGYEIIAGHTRKAACELAGLDTMPMFIRNLNDDEATIVMVDSNIQREDILPSERARAYSMRYYAMKHQGIDEIVELVVETIAMKTETIRIKGLDMPYEVVKSRFEKLDSVIIEYVLESVGNNTTKVRNIKNYLLTVLFNAPTTCNNYYVTEVNHDLYGKS